MKHSSILGKTAKVAQVEMSFGPISIGQLFQPTLLFLLSTLSFVAALRQPEWNAKNRGRDKDKEGEEGWNKRGTNGLRPTKSGGNWKEQTDEKKLLRKILKIQTGSIKVEKSIWKRGRFREQVGKRARERERERKREREVLEFKTMALKKVYVRLFLEPRGEFAPRCKSHLFDCFISRHALFFPT